MNSWSSLYFGWMTFSTRSFSKPLRTSTQWIVGREDVSLPRFGVSFLIDPNGVALERWFNQDASRVNGPRPSVGVPTHVVATYDGSRIQVWANGTPSGLAPSLEVVPENSLPIVIGAQSSKNGGFFQGTIDEVALYDRVLSPERISAHYRAGKAP